MKKWIEEPKYVFDINDIIGIIYILCVIGIMCNLNMTPLFFIGCAISFIACFKAKKINLVMINLAFLVLNGYNLIQLLMG